jgi:CRP-like cAMP-binding protein
LNESKSFRDTDLIRLSQIEALSWLSSDELGLLARTLTPATFKPPQTIFRQSAHAADAHILLRGVARITCRNGRQERVTIAMLAPGLLPNFPSLPLGRFDLRCEAYKDCRVGSLSWRAFEGVAAHNADLAFQKFHENDLQQWYRLLLRNSGFLNLGLHQRIALTLLELSSAFGVRESRGTLLRESFSHQEIAELVGASRPRVTEHLAQFEREHLLIRQGRQLIVCVDEIGAAQQLAYN